MAPPACKFAVGGRFPSPRGRNAGFGRRNGEVVQTADRTTQTPSAAAVPVLALGRYRLVRRLGAGAFGVVWLAHDEHLDRMVAVKRIELRDEQIAARAQREALAAARLSHPAIVALHEAGRDEEAIHLVSELVRGPTLADLLDAGALSDRDVLRIGIALTEALEHAHGRGVVHRDVKPANVIVPEQPSGESGIAKLTDFGVAAIVGDDGLTRTGDVVGTLAYMAPEQADGRPVTGAADLYALALVLYEALSGHNPVRARGAAATARRVGTRLPPLSRARPDLPEHLTAALDRALLADAASRGTLESLRDELTRARRGAATVVGHVDATPPFMPEQAGRWEDASGRHAPGRRPAGEEAARGQGAPARTQAAVSAAALAAIVLTLLPSAAGLTAGAATLIVLASGAGAGLLPRIAWLAAVGALIASLAFSGLAGVAVIVASAAIPVPLLLARRGSLWCAPAGAVAAALASLSLAWPALAGQAAGPLRRASLAAVGLWWILLAELLSGRELLFGSLPGVAPRIGWEDSAADAVSDVLWPLIESGALLIALPWAAAALVLPALVRGRRLALDLVAVTFWAVGLVAATEALAAGLALPSGGGTVHWAWAGALAGAMVALASAASRPPRDGADLP